MRLFNKYQSRALQFALELLARLNSGPLSTKQLQQLARAWGLDYADQVVEPLRRAGVLERTGDGCRLSPERMAARLPLSAAERAYLAGMLAAPEAELFLEQPLRTRLEALCAREPQFPPVQRYAPAGEPLPRQPGPEGFRTLLRAAERHWLIRYTYRTRDNDLPRQAQTLPWKIEYSAYDRRWWVILYDPQARRTIKARLDHLTDIEPVGPANVPEAEVEAAMERLLEPEPVVLEVSRTRGALERCFLVFENQLFEQTSQETDDCFRLCFRYYRFDRSEILRRLLYLGPAVRLVSPASLRRELAALTKQALEKGS